MAGSVAPRLKRTLARLVGDPGREAPRVEGAYELRVIVAEDGFAIVRMAAGRPSVLVGIDVDSEEASVQVFSDTGDEVFFHEVDAPPLLSLLEALRLVTGEDEPEEVVVASRRGNSG